MSVETAAPAAATHRSTYAYVGRLESTQDIELFARINGVLARRDFKGGQQAEGHPCRNLPSKKTD